MRDSDKIVFVMIRYDCGMDWRLLSKWGWFGRHSTRNKSGGPQEPKKPNGEINVREVEDATATAGDLDRVKLLWI